MERKKHIKNIQEFIDSIKLEETIQKKNDNSWMKEFEEIEKKYGLKNESKKKKWKNIYITDTFLISITKTDTDIIPLENIVWIYNYNEIQHQRGLTKLLHPLCIVTDRKKVFKIKHLSQKVSDTVINKILSRYPEILVGYKSRN